MSQTSTNWGKSAIHVKKEWVLTDIKLNLVIILMTAPQKANVILTNIKRIVLSLEINRVFMELLSALS